MNEPAANEPATREDVEKARKDILDRIDTRSLQLRAHVGSEIASVRLDGSYTKNFMNRLLTAIKKLLNKFGIGTDDI